MADVTTGPGHLLLTECRTVIELEGTLAPVKLGRVLTPEERQDVTRVKAMLARRAK